MQNLPNEILINTFSFLAPHHLLQIQTTCKSWNELITSKVVDNLIFKPAYFALKPPTINHREAYYGPLVDYNTYLYDCVEVDNDDCRLEPGTIFALQQLFYSRRTRIFDGETSSLSFKNDLKNMFQMMGAYVETDFEDHSKKYPIIYGEDDTEYYILLPNLVKSGTWREKYIYKYGKFKCHELYFNLIACDGTINIMDYITKYETKEIKPLKETLIPLLENTNIINAFYTILDAHIQGHFPIVDRVVSEKSLDIEKHIQMAKEYMNKKLFTKFLGVVIGLLENYSFKELLELHKAVKQRWPGVSKYGIQGAAFFVADEDSPHSQHWINNFLCYESRYSKEEMEEVEDILPLELELINASHKAMRRAGVKLAEYDAAVMGVELLKEYILSVIRVADNLRDVKDDDEIKLEHILASIELGEENFEGVYGISSRKPSSLYFPEHLEKVEVEMREKEIEEDSEEDMMDDVDEIDLKEYEEQDLQDLYKEGNEYDFIDDSTQVEESKQFVKQCTNLENDESLMGKLLNVSKKCHELVGRVKENESIENQPFVTNWIGCSDKLSQYFPFPDTTCDYTEDDLQYFGYELFHDVPEGEIKEENDDNKQVDGTDYQLRRMIREQSEEVANEHFAEQRKRRILFKYNLLPNKRRKMK